MKNKINIDKVITNFVFFSLVISFVFLVIRIIMAPAQIDINDPTIRVKEDYSLMVVQCLLGIVAMILPDLMKKRLSITIPSKMLVLYALFLYAAIFLGEVRSYYYNVNHWDTMLHTFSGGMLGALGFSFVTMLNKSEHIPMELSPLFVAFFSFCFAITIGVFWEVYEFSFDGLLGLNMQKFMLEDGTNLIGREALQDTMKDLIVDGVGAFVMSVIGYISLKYQKGWVEQMLLKFSSNSKDQKK